MAEWEYETVVIEASGFLGGKLDHGKVKSELARMGAAGWELVTAMDTSQSQGQTREVILFFKRPAD